MKTKTHKVKARPAGNSEDSAESFMDAESRDLIGAPVIFQGAPIAPYSEGIRLLWLNIFGPFSGNLFGVALIWMMRRLQELVDESQAESNEEQWEEAVIAFMRESNDVMKSRFRVVQWAAKLGEKGTTAAVKLANKFLSEAEKSDIAQTEVSEENTEGAGESGNA